MPKKRSSGEGTISHLPSGSWRAQVSLKGRRISHTTKSQQGARDWIRKIGAQIEQGYTYDDERITFVQFMEGWLASKQRQIRMATAKSYSDYWRKHIKPHFETVRLKDISPGMVQEFYDGLSWSGMKSGSIHIMHVILHSCLEQAKQLGLISRNPTDLCKVPKSQKSEMKVWNEDQVIQFLEHIKGHRNEHLYYLALITGMRRGELLGLKWIDVDWSGQRLRVQRQCYHPPGGGFIFQEPKTGRGNRNVQLGLGAIEHLRAQFNTIDIMRRISREKWHEYDLVFPSGVGTPQIGNDISLEFRQLVKRMGLPLIRLHDCRHTAATIMLCHGIPAAIVAEMLGHSMATLLNNYAHFLPNKQDEAARLMDEITRPIPVEIQPRRI